MIRAVLAMILAASLKGRIVFDGTLPRPKTLEVARDVRVCGKSQPDESLLVDSDGGLENVVISVENHPLARPSTNPPPATLDQVHCRYLPHVQALRTGTTLLAVNSDELLHTIRGSTGKGAPVFNVAFPVKGQKTPVLLRAPGMIRAQCDAGHTWMSAYIAVFDHPYFAVTRGDGGFEISGLPPGEYKLTLWHETLGTRSAVVKVPGVLAEHWK